MARKKKTPFNNFYFLRHYKIHSKLMRIYIFCRNKYNTPLLYQFLKMKMELPLIIWGN
jgi:hypothetical protein